MALHVVGWKIHLLIIPLQSEVRWAHHSEDHIEVVLLDLHASNGARGVAEMAVRKAWHGEAPAECLAELEKNLLPALRTIDLRSEAAFAAVLTRATGSPLARAIADMARADILAQVQGLALKDYFAGRFDLDTARVRASADAVAEVSFTIARKAPDAMAREVRFLQDTFGARAFKIKTGQGLDTDCMAVAAIRQATAMEAVFSANSNSAGPPEIVGAMADMLAGEGVGWFEDPCRLTADEGFVAVREASAVPVLVDNACRSLEAAEAFLDLGAQGLSIKLMKSGIGESLDIARLAEKRAARVTIGLCAATSLSAIYSLSIFAALPDTCRAMPCEETYFVNLQQDILVTPLAFQHGVIMLPDMGPLADRLDWRTIERLSVRHG